MLIGLSIAAASLFLSYNFGYWRGSRAMHQAMMEISREENRVRRNLNRDVI